VSAIERSPRVPIRRLVADFRPFARPGYIALVGVVLGVVCQVVTPLVVSVAIDRGVIHHSTGTIAWCVAVGLVLVAGVVAGSYVELRWMAGSARTTWPTSAAGCWRTCTRSTSTTSHTSRRAEWSRA